MEKEGENLYNLSDLEKEKYQFVFESEDGKNIDCEVLLSFSMPKKGKNYVLFTDNTYDEDNNLNVYVYYSKINEEELLPVTNEKELEMINKLYDDVLKMV